MVSIIVRTSDRQDLLPRSLESISNQTFDDWEVVLVDSGSTPAETADLPILGNRLQHLIVEDSIGLGGLLNRGILASKGDMIAILDDDDTWDSNFLQRMTDPLKSPISSTISGSVCHTLCLEEEMTESGAWITTRKYRQGRYFADLTLSDLAPANQFTINAFVFKKNALKEVGMYDEELMVAEDWDFNLRFLLHYDVFVVPELLAYYHRRSTVDTGTSANTFTHSADLHRHAVAQVINRHLREDLKGSGSGLGQLMAMTRSEARLRGLIAGMDKTVRDSMREQKVEMERLTKQLEDQSDKIGKVNSRTKDLRDFWVKKFGNNT